MIKKAKRSLRWSDACDFANISDGPNRKRFYRYLSKESHRYFFEIHITSS